MLLQRLNQRKTCGNHKGRPWRALEFDLEYARQVQECLFPRKVPRIPGWDMAALCRPARHVSGDYCDLFLVAPGRLAVGIGDVAGKGLGAGLVMAGLHALVRCCLRRQLHCLPCFFEGLNRYLLSATPEDLFVSLFLGVVELETGRMQYVNAGHPPPLVFAGEQRPPKRLGDGGPVLGILPSVEFAEGSAVLEPGSLLFLFTDGLTESWDEDGRMFGETGVVQVVRSLGSTCAGHLNRAVVKAIEAFCPCADGRDDLAVIALLSGQFQGC